MSDDSIKTEPLEVKVVQKELDLTVTEPSDTSKKVVVPRKRVRRKKVVAPKTVTETIPESVREDNKDNEMGDSKSKKTESDGESLDRLKKVVAETSNADKIEAKLDSDSRNNNNSSIANTNTNISTSPNTNPNKRTNKNSRNNGRNSYNNRNRTNRNRRENVNNTPLPTPDQPRVIINDLTKMTLPDLRNFAIEDGVENDDLISLTKQEVIFQVLKNHIDNKNGVVFAFGALEILPDGYGFLRSPGNSYLPGNDDIYVSPSQIRLFSLKTG